MGKVFFFTDIHGELPLFNAVMNYCSNDSLVIFGGDAIDRGKDGYKIMTALLNNPRVVYLKGNHEDMFVAAVKEFKQEFPNPQFSEERLKEILKKFVLPIKYQDKFPNLATYLYNGGEPTFIDWFKAGMDMEIIKKLENLSLTFSYNNLDFSHAGGAPNCFYRKEKNNYDIINLLWDRNCFELGWLPGRICIHGHTPTQIMSKKIRGNHINEPVRYHGDFKEEYTGDKINMDVGTYVTGRVFLLDCNTLSLIGFYDENINELLNNNHIIQQTDKITL